MHYIKIPEPASLPGAKGPKGEDTERTYTCEDMMDELIWDGVKRRNRRWFDELTDDDHFGGALPGDVVEVTNDEKKAIEESLDESLAAKNQFGGPAVPMKIQRRIKVMCRAFWYAPEKGTATRPRSTPTKTLQALERELEEAKAEAGRDDGRDASHATASGQ